MGKKGKGSSDSTRTRMIKLPGRLHRYRSADFGLQQRAVFFYYLLLAAMGFMGLILAYTVSIQLTTDTYRGLYLPVLVPEFLVLMVMVLCFVLLLSGRFSFASHLFMISTIGVVWVVMWMDRAEPLIRLDTFVLAMAILTMLPLVIKRNKWAILLYMGINLAFLPVFFIFNRNEFNVSTTTLIEFLSDVSIAMFFIGVVAFNIFRINNQALNKAVADFNERIEAERALSESEKKFGEMTEMLPQTVFEADINGRLTYLNQTGAAVFGITPDDIRHGISIFMAVSKKDRRRVIENFKINMRGGQLEGIRYTALRKDGTELPVEIYTKPFTRDDILQGIRGIIVDLSERHEAERAIKESELRYKALMESMNEAIIVADNDHKVLFVNRQFTEKLGYAPDEIVGKTGYKMLHDPEDLKVVEQANSKRTDGQASIYELTFIAKDGHKIDFLVSGAPFRNLEGETIGSIGALTDITERKKADKALRESQQQFQTLAEMSPVGIFRTRPDGYTTYVNPRWSEISGLSFEEAIGDGWMKAVHPDDRNTNVVEWYDRVNKKVRSVSQYRFIKPDGSISWVLGSAVPEVIDGVVRGYIGTITDITEAKIAEKELEKYRNHLEQLVHDRTLDLAMANKMLKATNEELDRQKKELQEAYNNLRDTQKMLIHSEKMASLGVLAAGIAHEINNPLNFINGGAYALETYVSENMKEHMNGVAPLIEGIQVGVKRAAEIVASLNLYSRRDDLPGSECKIHSIIDNCLVMVNNELKYRIEVNKKYTRKDLSVFGNEGRLHQVFLNVLTNAIHAIKERGTITIFTERREDRCYVIITDTGCGISSEVIHKITDPFFTTKDPGKGTGLGLSITYNILKDYDGTIEFESEEGKGTKVIISLPLLKR